MVRYSLLSAILFVFSSAWSQTATFTNKLSQIERDVPLLANDAIELQTLTLASKKNQIYRSLSVFMAKDEQLKALFIENELPAELRFFCLAALDGDLKASPYFTLSFDVATSRKLKVTNYLDERNDLILSATAYVEELKAIDQGRKTWLRSALYASASNEERAVFNSCDSFTGTQEFVKCLPIGLASLYRGFVSFNYLVNYATELKLDIRPVEGEYAKVKVLKYATLYQLARNLGMPANELKGLNTIYTSAIIPGDEGVYFLTIPNDKLSEWTIKGDLIYEYPSLTKTYTATEIKILEKTVRENPSRYSYVVDTIDKDSEDSLLVEVTYAVRNGDILVKIADLFDCEVVQLKRWNNLSNGNTILIDQQIVIKVPLAQRAYYQRIDAMTNAQRKAVLAKD